MIEPLASQPALIDQVHDRLVAAIADGTLPPGERLTQENMAALLGVSRQPVSHALQMLRMRGLAVEAGKRGLVVAPLDAARLRELYQVRSALEGLAARLAAMRVRNGQAPQAQRFALEEALAAGRELPQDAGMRMMIEADVAFHSALYAMSGNRAIVESVAAQWPHFMRAMGAVLADGGRRAAIWSDHAEILKHVLAGAPDGADTAARTHVQRAAEATAAGLESVEAVA